MDDLVEIRGFRSDDAALLAAEMREMDKTEWRAMMGTDPDADQIQRMADRSAATQSAFYDGKLVAIYGVIRPVILSRDGSPWLLATTQASDRRVRRRIAVQSRSEMLRLFSGFNLLWNVVSVENRDAVRWLKWLGFSFLDHSAVEVRGVMFVPFKMEF